MWSLYKDPNGKNVFDEKESAAPSSSVMTRPSIITRPSFINKQESFIDKAKLRDSQEMCTVCLHNY